MLLIIENNETVQQCEIAERPLLSVIQSADNRGLTTNSYKRRLDKSEELPCFVRGNQQRKEEMRGEGKK